jgi:hypothetical protein
MTEATLTKPTSKRPRKMACPPQQEVTASSASAQISGSTAPSSAPKPDRPQSKAALVLDLLRHPTGVSIDELVAATGWLPHSIRAALTGLRKKGYLLTSEKVDGVRHYRVEGPAA